jgi:hypothetical protein
MRIDPITADGKREKWLLADELSYNDRSWQEDETHA